MKLTEEQIKKISADFDSIKDISDLCTLINYIDNLIKARKESRFSIYKLNYFAFHQRGRYKVFKISKRNGQVRKIKSPRPYLKVIQKCINIMLQVKFTSHHASHGFLNGKSIVTNASKHVYKTFVLNIDITNFFESVDFRRVKTVLGLQPFNLSEIREPIAFLISNLCCDKGSLPQGAPSSPILTNIVCQRLDRKLFQLSKEFGAKYTRYADDITFSCNNEIFDFMFMNQLEEIIVSEGFKINSSKTRIQCNKDRQEVTGIIVNKKVNVARKFVREIRAILHNYEYKGQQRTQEIFVENWKNPNQKAPQFDISLKGKIDYLGMVRGKKDPLYLKYKTHYVKSFSKHSIDYSFIQDEYVKTQLNNDCDKMFEILMNTSMSTKEKFTNYCTHAFYQIEVIVNYYLSRRFTFDELLVELTNHTFFRKDKSQFEKGNVGSIQAIFKVFLFEKYFYYLPGMSYKSVITKIRIVRNNNVHKDNAIRRTEEIITTEYHALQDRIRRMAIPTLTKEERKLENEFSAIPFLKEANFSLVLNTVKDVVEKVKLSSI